MFRSSLLVLMMHLTALLHGQVVNIEGRRFDDNDTSAWKGFLGFKFNAGENTQRFYDLGLNIGVRHLWRHKHRLFLFTDYTVSRVEDNAFQNRGFQHLRYNYAYDKRWTGEAFVQTLYNKPLLLDLRFTMGAGPRLRVVDSEHYRMYIASLLMYEHELTTPGEILNDGRSSSYVSGFLRFTEMAELGAAVYYQPRLFDASDHRIAIESRLVMRFTRRYQFEMRLNLLKDTAQPEGAPAISYKWENAFTVVL
ncbi:MAG: DUF481 domain-containing protein [Flavobacteriales bacterium]|nr:DUF481 domain-containing protein [Flavobacteriales bacterium]